MDEIQQTIATLENIELLAAAGVLGNPLTDIMARLHIAELQYQDTRTDGLERANKFIVQCEQETVGG